MLNTRALYTGTKSKLGHGVLSEVERIALLLWQAKGDTVGSCPSKTVSPNLGGFDEEFYNNDSRAGLLIRLRSMQGLHSFNLASGGLQISFSGSWSYQTVTFSLEWGLLHLPFIGGFSSIKSSENIVMCIPGAP